MSTQLGVIGLATMGANLARNAARNGATVAVYNRTHERMEGFIHDHGKEGMFVPCKNPSYLVAALKPPRPVLLMVKAGEAVDAMIAEVAPLLQEGDILIDAGNSHYRDSERREKELAKRGIRFLGMGVSGGEQGALLGPSIMPGGSHEAFTIVEPLLQKMAAEDGEGGKCVAFMGSGGSGHFVKMVHNGIEYGIMQLIAESYDLLRREVGMSNTQLAELFASWNADPWLQSFLIEITARIFPVKDRETEKELIDVILDSAGQKGTGKWTTETALHYGVAIPTINAAVDARIISSGKEFRVQESKQSPLHVSERLETAEILGRIRTALELSIINAYAQGFQLLFAASAAEGWDLNISEIARIWRGGCIIRSHLLSYYQKMFAGDAQEATTIRGRFSADAQLAWRDIVALGALRGIPLPAMSASLSYFDAYRTERLPQNLLQAQRDFFGAHTYARTDKEGVFHTEWEA